MGLLQISLSIEAAIRRPYRFAILQQPHWVAYGAIRSTDTSFTLVPVGPVIIRPPTERSA